MQKQTRADAAMALTILLLAATLAMAGITIWHRWTSQGHLQHSLGFADVLGAAAAIAGVGAVVWWLAGMLLAFASAILFRGGRRRLAQAAGSLSPAFMRRLAAAVVGLNLLTAPLAYGATVVDPLWQDAAPASFSSVASLPGPSGQPSEGPVNPLWQPRAPLPDPGPLAQPQRRLPSWFLPGEQVLGSGSPASSLASPQPEGAPHRTPERHTATAENTLVVLAGDTLWTIAARQLGPFATDVEVAARWPLWYHANRATIGSDPNVLYPGQLLQAPNP